jgi:DNA-binding Xre family transcriptional regulator
MPMINKVKPFLERRRMSVYQFIKDTGVAPATGYKLAKSSSYLPGIRVLEVICDTYQIQPGEIVEWVSSPSIEKEEDNDQTAE